MSIKSLNGNMLHRIAGKYSEYYLWVIDDRTIKPSTESEYYYLCEKCSEDNFIDIEPPKIAIDYINEIESHVGDFIPYNQFPFLYNTMLKRMFGDSFNKSSLMDIEDCLWGYDDSIDLDSDSEECALLNWYGGYHDPSACLDGLIEKYQFVFTDKSTYHNDYMGRIRNIYCGINYIEFEAMGRYGSVNGLDFELKIYKKI